ncbi:MAG: HAD family hydrolase [Acidobacteria bacterium]|nr:HAD family hydrolase [Acidobacteriota bacterium]
MIFDGDDTLWETEPLYDEARSEARGLVEASGGNGSLWERLQREIDVKNVDVHGFSASRFPLSCVTACEKLFELTGWAVPGEVVQRINAVAMQVFDGRAPVRSDAEAALALLRANGFNLGLLTKGNQEVQQRRIESSGLARWFDRIEIVGDKSPEVISQLVRDLGSEPRSSWLVGNSLRSDIVPAVSAGLHAIRLDAHTWEYERDYVAPPGLSFLTAGTLTSAVEQILDR